MEYIIRQLVCKAGEWTKLSDGERVVAVIGTHRASGETVYVTALVERLPRPPGVVYQSEADPPPSYPPAVVRELIPEAA